MRAQNIRRLSDDQEGSAVVEASVLTPVLCALVFGVLEFSFFFYEQHLISTGVRDAARYLARTNNPEDATTQTKAKNLATTGTVDTGGTARVQGWDAAGVAVTFTNVENPIREDGLRDYRGGDIVPVVHVTGTFNYTSFGFLGFFGFTAPTITIVHTQRVIGRS